MDLLSGRKNSLKICFGAILLIFFLIILVFKDRPDGKLRVVFCNVGQGDAMVIQTPANQTILVDAGPDNKVLACLGSKLPFYRKEIDFLILTHLQADHIRGAVEVLRRYRVGMVGVSGIEGKGEEWKAVENEVKMRSVKGVVLKRGDRIDFGQGLNMEVLWPDEKLVEAGVSDLNDASLVLRLNYGNLCALLMGDAGEKVQQDLVSFGQTERCQILKVAHHGSKTGTLPAYLDLIQPRLAVISVGKNNFGHPAPEVLGAFQSRNVRVLRTDQGTIEIVGDGGNWQFAN